MLTIRPFLSRCRSVPQVNKTYSGYMCGDTPNTDEPVDLRTCTDQEIRAMIKTDVRSQTTQANINILGTGGNELAPFFLLSCVSRTYMFNQPEGLKRMLENSRVVVRQDPIILFTRASWENASGCFGSYHMFAERFQQMEASAKPEGFEQSEDETRKRARVDVHYCGPKDIDRYIEYLCYTTGKSTWKDIRQFNPGKLSDQYVDISVVDIMENVVAYSCKMADWHGTLLPEKAVELGIPPGPAFKVILSGRSVISMSGELVHTSQVVKGAKKGPTFVVVDCPTEDVMDALTDNRYLQPEWYSRSGEAVRLVVHITPLEILQNESYCKWMASFGEDTKHLFVHSSVCPGEVSYRAAMSFSLPFHLMNPSVYRLPCVPDQNIIHKTDLNVCKYINKDSITFARSLMKYNLKPSLKVDNTNCFPPIENEIETALSTIEASQDLSNSISRYRKAVFLSPTWSKNDVMSSLTQKQCNLSALTDSNDVQVTFLGTSSAESTKTRNVSGILVQTLADGNILLDCGEGTLCQLYRCFGKKYAEEILRKLELIFISHLHPDHQAGLCSVLSEIGRLAAEDGRVKHIQLLNSKIQNLLSGNPEYTSKGIKYEVVDARGTFQRPFSFSNDITLQAVPVRHIKDSYGIVIRAAGNGSVVYSGDTMPCRNLVQAGQNATLLIHEATLEEELQEEAKKKLHSTFQDAVKVGRDMNAEFLLTTHFSARYILFPLLYPWPRDVCPAVDFMSVRLSNVHRQVLNSRHLNYSIREWSFKSIDNFGHFNQDPCRF